MLNATVLGKPAHDNALWVEAGRGNGLTRLLLDCGSHTLDGLSLSDIMQTDHLLLSHLHIDHIAGFDDFFRVNFERASKPNHIWGPPGCARILGHRFQGFWWSHAAEMRSSWHVHEVDDTHIHTWRFEAHEAFTHAHDEGLQARSGPILHNGHLSVEAVTLRHHGPCLGYLVREPEQLKVNTAALAAAGLKAGPWLSRLKEGGAEVLDIDGVPHDAAALRSQLLEVQRGDSLAYLTDFLLDETETARLAALLGGIHTLYLEAQYAPGDAELALKNHHTTVQQGATLAQRSGVQDLVLLHLSRRYRPADWSQMLGAAQALFPAARFPAHWAQEVASGQ